MIYDGDRGTFRDLEMTVRRTTCDLRPHLDKFDALAVTGVSGDSVGFPVALRLGVPIVSVRKDKDNNHQSSGGGVAGYRGLAAGARVLFLDDFIVSGATRARVAKALRDLKTGADLVGEYLYHDGGANKGALYWKQSDGLWPKARREY